MLTRSIWNRPRITQSERMTDPTLLQVLFGFSRLCVQIRNTKYCLTTLSRTLKRLRGVSSLRERCPYYSLYELWSLKTSELFIMLKCLYCRIAYCSVTNGFRSLRSACKPCPYYRVYILNRKGVHAIERSFTC